MQGSGTGTPKWNAAIKMLLVTPGFVGEITLLRKVSGSNLTQKGKLWSTLFLTLPLYKTKTNHYNHYKLLICLQNTGEL